MMAPQSIFTAPSNHHLLFDSQRYLINEIINLAYDWHIWFNMLPICILYGLVFDRHACNLSTSEAEIEGITLSSRQT